jgi:hypothetical protein
MNYSNTRKVTNQLLELMDQGVLSPELLVRTCFSYMSEDEVADMAWVNGLIEDDEEDSDTN